MKIVNYQFKVFKKFLKILYVLQLKIIIKYGICKIENWFKQLINQIQVVC